MKTTKVAVAKNIEFNVVEMTRDEVLRDFGYDISDNDGAITELAIEDGEGSLFAYGLESGEYAMYISGRGLYRKVASRDEAMKMLVEDEMRWQGM